MPIPRLQLLRRSFSLACVLAGIFAVPSSAQVDVPITNHSFESPVIAPGTFDTSAAPPGWGVFGMGIDFGNRTIGVLNPGGTSLYPGPVPDGSNVGVAFLLDNPGDQTQFAGIEAGLEQITGIALQGNTRYVLSVEVGNIDDDPNPPNNQFQFSGFPGYRIELTAGGATLITDDNSLLPAEGTFLPSTLVFTTGPNPPQVGQMLGIRLVNLNAAPGLEVNFDNVQLTAQVASLVPALGAAETAFFALLVFGVGLLMVRRRRTFV